MSGEGAEQSPVALLHASQQGFEVFVIADACGDVSTEAHDRAMDRMVQAGVGVVLAGVLGYALVGVGLAIGNRAEGDLFTLAARDDIDRRRDVLARGKRGNQLAIGGAIAATAALAVGIPLIVIGRRRHEAVTSRTAVMMTGGAEGLGLRVQGRF